jgi:murein DD-endopeptidase MepM/ murein hydrolase activator NlpD
MSSIYTAYAVSASDAQEVQNQINDTQNEIDEVQENLSQEMKTIQELEGDISEVEYNLQKIESELKSLNNEISELEEKVEEAEKEYNERYDNACQRIVAQYKYGNITYLDVLLNSSSLTEMLSNYYMVQKITEADEKLLDDISEKKEQIENDKAELEEKKKTVESDKEEVEKQKIILSNKKVEKEKMVKTLNDKDAELQQQKEEYYEELNAIQEELRKLAAQAAQQSTGSSTGSSVKYSGGTLQFPCPNLTRISSYFGSRTAPLGGASSYHKGIDMAATMGTSVISSEAGTVIKVSNTCTHNYGKSKSCGCGGGYGNYIMINHGGGLVSLYGHLTSIAVSNGDTVTRGQLIGTVGSTGASSGYHLHYSIILDGVYVDPAPYIGL